MELDEEQRRAVYESDVHSLVIAGPGSGKTRVLTHKAASLEGDILLLTFTNKAARNMMERVDRLGARGRIVGGTFHHIANRILRERERYSIIDNEDSVQIIARIIKEREVDLRAREVFDIISKARNSALPLHEFLRGTFLQDHTKILSEIYTEYQRRKEEMGVRDFEDLLEGWLKVGVGRYDHVLVDEYQDTNRLQFNILKALGKHALLFAVGDDSQSIYGFRAADIRNMLEFTNTFTPSKVFYLRTNYRSTRNIVRLINRSIERNRIGFPKELTTNREHGELPVVLPVEDERDEGRKVVAVLRSLIAEFGEREVAVLYRSNYQSMYLEVELARDGIPYTKFGGLRLFEQAHLKDMIAFAKIAMGYEDELSWVRVLSLFKGVGPKGALEKYKAIIRGESFSPLLPFMRDSLSESLTTFYEGFYKEYVKDRYENWRERLNDCEMLIEMAEEYGDGEEFLEDVMLEGPRPSRGEGVTLSTIHQAKGLEWKAVVMIGLVDGAFPSRLSLEEGNIEEERRLFYVGCSRAKDRLVLVVPYSYRGKRAVPSLFVRELPDEVYSVNPFNG